MTLIATSISEVFAETWKRFETAMIGAELRRRNLIGSQLDSDDMASLWSYSAES